MSEKVDWSEPCNSRLLNFVILKCPCGVVKRVFASREKKDTGFCPKCKRAFPEVILYPREGE